MIGTMRFFDRRFIGRVALNVFTVALLIFMCCLIVAWWWNVLRFFFYDHWKPTCIVLAILLTWFLLGLVVERIWKHRQNMIAHRDYMDYGDQD